MKNEREYYAAREQAERAAAEKALSPKARQAHEELADAYKLKLDPAPTSTEDPAPAR